MITLTDQNFAKEVLEIKGYILVDFWAPWCGPCRTMEPVVEKIAQNLKDEGVRVGKVNVDEVSQIPSRYNIMSIPTLILFKDGKPLEQMIGAERQDDLEKKIRELLK